MEETVKGSTNRELILMAEFKEEVVTMKKPTEELYKQKEHWQKVAQTLEVQSKKLLKEKEILIKEKNILASDKEKLLSEKEQMIKKIESLTKSLKQAENEKKVLAKQLNESWNTVKEVGMWWLIRVLSPSHVAVDFWFVIICLGYWYAKTR